MTTATIHNFQPRSLLIGLVMLLAAGLAVLMTPSRKVADGAPAINLDAMIPKAFGDWKVDEKAVALPVAPDVKAKLDKIYSQTLARTYVNGKGQRVMLSIAYGGDQSDTMQAHRPEVCYPAQGFQVEKQTTGTLGTPFGNLAVKRLVAHQGRRVEPITYWFVTGGQINTGSLERKLAQLRFGITGQIPDGLLFRISSLQPDVDQAFLSQTEFVVSLLQSITESARSHLIGNLEN